MSKFIHAIVVTATLIEADAIFDINAVDKKGYAGEYLIQYPDGKKAIVSAEIFDKEFHEVPDDFEHQAKPKDEEIPELTDEEEKNIRSTPEGAKFLDELNEESKVAETATVTATLPAINTAEVIASEEKPSSNGVEHKEEAQPE